MVCYVITLEPEKKIADEISGIKQKIHHKIGDQLYLRDPPHITIYLGYFKDSLNNVLNEASKKIKEQLSPIKVTIGELDTFGKDIISKKETLFLTVKDKENKIQKIQKIIIDSLSSSRTNETPLRYTESYESLDKTFKENIDKHGYPFIGEVFTPHISLGLFDYPKAKEIIEELIEKFPYGDCELNRIVIYELNEKTEELKELEAFNI